MPDIQRKKVLLIDGNSILNRAFYGVKPLTTRDGRPTNAIYGFVNIIMKQVESLRPDGIGVAFDLKAPTFRHKKYELYKANRHGMPEELAFQLPLCKKAAELFGFRILSLEGFEADDILGTGAKTCIDDEAADYDCYILTGDRDSLQLISDKSFVLLATNTETIVYDKARFAENYAGLAPEKLVELKALMGDTSDNIPGIPGVGEKTALKLICDYGSVDGLYENYESSSLSPKMKEKIADGKDSAYMSRFLAEICRSVPLDLSFASLARGDVDKSGLLSLFSDLELRGFIERFDLENAGSAQSGSTESAPIKAFDDFEETEDVGSIGCSGDTYVFPDFASGKLYITAGGKNFLASASEDNLRKLFAGERPVVLYDSKDTAVRLLERGLPTPNCAFDLKLAAYLCDPGAKNEPQDLSGLAKSTIAPMGDGQSRAFGLLLAMPFLKDYFSKTLFQNKSEKLFYEVEMPLAMVLAKMERTGMRLDGEGLRNYNSVLESRAEARRQNIYALAGTEFNVNSPKQLGEILFEKLGLPGMKKTKSGFSTDAETLEHLRPIHPIINEILDFRALSKLKSTYGDGLLEAQGPDGRVRTVFKQAFTQTGRLSSAEPNLQNIPIKSAEGREIRKFFVPENSDYCLIDADYSQIELRILAALSGDETMVNTFIEGGDIHRTTASQVFGVKPEEVTPEMRKQAKAVNFGIVYGISDFSLAGDIGVSKKEAAAYIAGYFAKYPGVDRYLAELRENASRDGFVTTIFGRRRYIPELQSSKKVLVALGERLAMNTPIQGTAADIIKIAMVNCDKALEESGLDARLILQVHDELIVEAKKDCADAVCTILRESMENAVSLKVPLSVELCVGDTWFDAH